MTPLILDIYHGDTVVDFGRVKASGIAGVIHKASQGGSIVDQAYATRRKLAKAAGLLWGAYHFFDYSAPAAHQADHFLSVAAPDAATLVALDWENVGNREPSAGLAREFLEEIETKLNRKAVIYSGNVAKEQLKGKDDYFGSHRLWLCEYGAEWKVQESWTTPWLWQFSETGIVSGMSGHCDVNCIVAPMTPEQLTTEWAT